MLCPFKFSHYEFEGGQDCIGIECGMHKLCGANDTLAAENDVSEVKMDANDGNADTREKLEAEAFNLFNEWSTLSDDAAAFLTGCVAGYLDRQAAITLRECKRVCDTCNWPEAANAQRIVAMKEADKCFELQDAYDDMVGKRNELQAKVDELTEQRDRWRSNWTERNMAYSELADDYQELEAKVDELTDQLESAHAKNRALKAHISKMQDGRHGWHIKGKELQARVDELERENAKLSSDELHLRNALAQSEHELATMREKLGRMLDNAHEITRIGGDC